MSTIRVDYSNARAQAKKLQTVASDCNEVVRHLNSAINNVPNYWDGSSADAFILSVQSRIKDIKKISNDASILAAQIRRVADELEAAERRIQAEITAQTGSLTARKSTASLSPASSSSGGTGGGFR